jgi:aerobic carbon-monoxide dehydrogenase medium subunit
MKPAAFVRHVPKTLDEALKILAQVAPQDGRVLAGGQSLVPIMAFRLAKPAHLVDINEVAGLDKITSDGKSLAIGACVRHAAFHKSVVANPLGALLCEVARHIAHYPIRMRGTFCGSLAHADPASEWCLVAATLDATMVTKSTRGEREIAAADFFQGIMSTALEEDELLAEARLPLLADEAKFGFNEFNRRAGDFAMSAALVTYTLQDGKIASARVGVGGAEPFPRLIPEAEAALNGQAPDDAAFRAAAEAASQAIEPLEDHQTTGGYRRDLVRAVVRRALEQSA